MEDQLGSDISRNVFVETEEDRQEANDSINSLGTEEQRFLHVFERLVDSEVARLERKVRLAPPNALSKQQSSGEEEIITRLERVADSIGESVEAERRKRKTIDSQLERVQSILNKLH